MVTFESLPFDILTQITNQLDASSKVTLGTVSKFISRISINQLWRTPECKSINSLRSILTTLNNLEESNFYPYASWIFGINISHLVLENLPESIHLLLKSSIPIPVRTLRLDHIDGSLENCHYLFQLFIQPQALTLLELCNCSSHVTFGIANYLFTQKTRIEALYIKDSYLSDLLVKQMVTGCSQLLYFRSEGSGYISDTSVIALSSSCSLIQAIIITLPNYLVQSNTITFLSLQALVSCAHLTTFICKGQVRISNEDSKQWLLKNCLNLKYCDLSF